jgi:hypothetical protein
MKEKTKTGAALGSGAALGLVTAVLISQGLETPPTQEQINCGLLVQPGLHLEDETRILVDMPPEVSQLHSSYRKGDVEPGAFVSACLETLFEE